MKIRSNQVIRFLTPSGMRGVQAVYGANVTNEFARHMHTKFCIGVVQQGARIFSQAGMSVVVPENAMFVINPGIAHAFKSQSNEGHSYLVICVDSEKVRHLASQISEKAQPVPYIRHVLLLDAELVSQVRQFFSLLRQADSILKRGTILTSMLAELILRYGDMPPILRHVGSQRNAIERVCEYIREHFNRTLSLEELAGVACLSPFHFHRLFVKNTGMSPHEYVIQIRIDRARELLLKGNSIAEVSTDVGFVDQSHFTRFFKRVVGIAPGRFVGLHKQPF
jgi:AraC-like DNA-binding protein